MMKTINNPNVKSKVKRMLSKLHFSIFTLLFIVIGLFIFSCTENSLSYQRESTDLNWNIFKIDQVDYDSLHIENKDSVILHEKLVDKISLYSIENYDYILQDTLTPNYIATDDGYYIHFRFKKKLALEKLYYEFAIRYQFNDGSFIEIDTTHLMLKYPYKSAKVIFNCNEVNTRNDKYFHFQDIDFKNNTIYYHPLASYGLYDFNLESRQNNELVNYSGGDFIAFDSNYVFMDICHVTISRYNIVSKTVDLDFDLSSLDYDDINGMECWNGKLFVVFTNDGNNYIAKFDYDGEYIESIQYSKSTFYLTIDSGIAYSHDYNKTLYRFDLESETFLSDLKMPAYGGEGIRIHDNQLFFVAYNKKVIGYIPISELK